MNMEQQLVPGRTCGSCNVCCIALTIDDPALRKPQGYRCHNAQPDNGCGIYANRPHTCRAFYCGWRLLRWVRDTLRPDQTDVLVQLIQETDGHAVLDFSVAFTLLTVAGLEADGLAESIAASVAANIRTYLVIPGPPGYTSSQAQVNEMLGDAVRARDKAEVLGLLRESYAIGNKGPRAKIVLRG